MNIVRGSHEKDFSFGLFYYRLCNFLTRSHSHHG